MRDVNSNAIVSVVAEENATEDHEPEFKHPMVMQNKPRIVVSYGNVYKQTPVDPIQNLLTYFLMNVARDFAQDQDQFDRRRSPGFFTDAKTSITEVGNKIVNESENIGEKMGDAFRTIASREIPAQTHYEEAHFYPHIDGTCMCFNRLIRHGPVEMKNDLHVKDGRINEQFNQSPESKESKDVTIGQMKTDKTVDFKTDNNIVISNKEKNVGALAEIPREVQQTIKQNSTSGVRVLKVLDLDNLETNAPSVDTTESKVQLEQKASRILNSF